jgi:hypothetical protein
MIDLKSSTVSLQRHKVPCYWTVSLHRVIVPCLNSTLRVTNSLLLVTLMLDISTTPWVLGPFHSAVTVVELGVVRNIVKYFKHGLNSFKRIMINFWYCTFELNSHITKWIDSTDRCRCSFLLMVKGKRKEKHAKRVFAVNLLRLRTRRHPFDDIPCGGYGSHFKNGRFNLKTGTFTNISDPTVRADGTYCINCLPIDWSPSTREDLSEITAHRQQSSCCVRGQHLLQELRRGHTQDRLSTVLSLRWILKLVSSS